MPPTSPGEIKFIINKLPRNKAPGPNGITNTALKHLSGRISYILHITKIFNTCLHLKYLPVKWKQAMVIMIPKHGKDQKTPNNHRPISLINTLGKVFEITLAKRLKIDILRKIKPEQFAFRPEHTTTSQLIKLVDYLSNTTNRGEKTAVVFFDLEKTFDKVWHGGLLHKLIKLGTTSKLVFIIKSFILKTTYNLTIPCCTLQV